MLTERLIRDAKSTGKTRTVWDAKVPGLGLQVTRGGTKNFVIRYAVDGKRRQAILCRVGQLPLAEARKRAGAELAAIRAGEADPLQRREDRRAAPTVAEGLDRFFGEFVPRRMADGRLSERTVQDYRAQAARTVRPALGDMKIAAVTRADIERAVAKRAPVQRNRTLAFIARLFSAFQDWELVADNPARRIERAREEPRDRVLAPSEIKALGEALAACPDPFAAGAIRWLMVTGWRTGEALGLRWDAINFETGEITLPATKTGRDIRQVGAMASELLARLPRVNGNEFVFAGVGTGGLTYATLRRRFQVACDAAGIHNAKLHDIRRSVATSAAASGVSVFMLRDLLGHRTVAMASRYARRAPTALQEAQDAVAARMTSMLDGEDGKGKVLPLRSR